MFLHGEFHGQRFLVGYSPWVFQVALVVNNHLPTQETTEMGSVTG